MHTKNAGDKTPLSLLVELSVTHSESQMVSVVLENHPPANGIGINYMFEQV